MFFVLESPDAMASLPIVNKNFSVFGLVAQAARQAAVIFMRVREHNATNVIDCYSRLSKSSSQSIDRLLCFRTGIDDGDLIFFDEINIDRSDIEGGWKRDGDDVHTWRLRICLSSTRNSSRSRACFSKRRDLSVR